LLSAIKQAHDEMQAERKRLIDENARARAIRSQVPAEKIATRLALSRDEERERIMDLADAVLRQISKR
jgi:hypothetical protein